MRRVTIPFALAAVAACQPQAGPLSEADVAAIRAVAAELDSAALAHDWDRVFALFAADALGMAQGYPTIEVRGRVFGVLRKQPDRAWRITVWSTNTES